VSDLNPSLEAFIERMMELRLADLHVSLPAKVIRYDAEKQQADVQPLLQRRYTDGRTVELPVITNVPVWHARAGTAIIHMPVKPDHIVQLVFSERSLDRWKSQGGRGAVDPADPRKHHLSDCVAYPGGYPFADASPVGDEDAIEIKNEDVELRVRADGKVSIKAPEILLGDHNLTEQAAIASRVEARLSALESGLSTLISEVTLIASNYSLHGHPTNPIPVAPGTVDLIAVPPGPFVPDTSVVGSDTVLVEV